MRLLADFRERLGVFRGRYWSTSRSRVATDKRRSVWCLSGGGKVDDRCEKEQGLLGECDWDCDWDSDESECEVRGCISSGSMH